MSTQQNPQVESQKASNGRDANGRFAKGNMGGPGNPFARQAARMRQAFSGRVSDDKLNALIDSMVELGIGGNVHAAKLVFHYVIGKPTEAFNPDRMDQEEFELYKEGDGNCAQAMRMMQEPDTKLPVSALRAMRWVNHDKGKDAIMGGMRRLDQKEGVVREPGSPLYVPPKVEEAPIGDGENGDAAPIGNGGNGRGPELFERYGAKMSRRALKKARKAAKLAAMMPSKNGKH